MKYSNNFAPINPNRPCKIFVFSIYKALNGGKSVYNATRSAWSKRQIGRFLNSSVYEYAVGLKDKISLGSYRINSWSSVPYDRYEFTGQDTPEFTGFSWDKQIDAAGGYWNFGGPLVVEFDGHGKFRLLLPNKDHWFNC